MVSDYRKSKELGIKAFTQGRKLIPAQDKDMMKILSGKSHKDSIRFLRAYQKGFVGESLK